MPPPFLAGDQSVASSPLIRHPRHRAALAERPDLIRTAIEELLRFSRRPWRARPPGP
jgi:hypothetical protein